MKSRFLLPFLCVLLAAPLIQAADTDRGDRMLEAYFRAERRGFAAGHELEDWVAAEAAVDSRRQRMQVA